MIFPFTLGSIARALLALIVLLTLITAGSWAAFGSDLRSEMAQTVPAGDPVTIAHDPGEEPVITDIATGEELDEGRVIRLQTKMIAVGRPGVWIARVAGRFSVWIVAPDDPPPRPMLQENVQDEPPEAVDNPKPEETQLVRVPPELAAGPIRGPTVWFLTGAPGTCQPCDQWKAVDYPELKARGVTIHEVPPGNHDQKTPTFIMAAVGKSPVQRTGRWRDWTDAAGILEFMGLE
jgi:hypothetical protein